MLKSSMFAVCIFCYLEKCIKHKFEAKWKSFYLFAYIEYVCVYMFTDIRFLYVCLTLIF